MHATKLTAVEWPGVAPMPEPPVNEVVIAFVPGPPQLAALELAGTRDIYVDTADLEQLADVAAVDGVALAEIDGNTINQPLMDRVLERELDPSFRAWLDELRRARAHEEFLPLAYAAANVRIARAIHRRLAAGRTWQVSLQVHMTAAKDARRTVELGRAIARAVPGALVKVPFLPQQPQCLLAARDLERSGVLVNLTSTFSARQVVVAALLVGAARTNVFAGRLNEGLSAKLLGEHVALEAQRLLAQLRLEHGIGTRLIVASVREWRTLVRTAGCDAFTAPPDALRAFLEQEEVEPDRVESRLETSYAEELGIAEETQALVSRERIERLQRVEPELIEFIAEYRTSREFAELEDGDQLWSRFDAAGFGDLFHAPSPPERNRLRASKLPDLRSPLVQNIALDTLFTLHADADFEKHQEQMDRRILQAAGIS